MQKLKGLWIPVEILLNEELNDKEKIVLSMILYLSEETKSCFASNKYIANIVDVTADGKKLKKWHKRKNSSLQNLQNARKCGIINIIAIAMLKPL
ncbi:MAG: hypothetical protein ACLU8F_00140 [Clostridia bacterium]